jgi:RNA polymerase sigma-70 factor (ECF subfamily)
MKEKEDRRRWVLAALEEFEGRLVRYARRLLGSEEEARDVVQFVFLRLCDEEREEVGGRLAPWLFTVCRNRAMDVLRAAGKGNGKPHAEKEAASREADPAEAMEQTDLHGLLRRVVQELPANQREAIDLWAEGFRYAEISEILECEEGNVRVIVHRGLKAVREDRRVRAVMEEVGGRRSEVGEREVISGQ